MSDKRYYYTDPLAAAWMAKHFGMRFYTGGGDMCVITVDFALNRYGEDFASIGGKLYIRPDSVHLLEPREGDTVTAGGGKYYFLCGNSGVFGIPLQSLPQAMGPLGMKQLWIIQRDSKPFFWPESEEAAKRSTVRE